MNFLLVKKLFISQINDTVTAKPLNDTGNALTTRCRLSFFFFIAVGWPRGAIKYSSGRKNLNRLYTVCLAKKKYACPQSNIPFDQFQAFNLN